MSFDKTKAMRNAEKFLSQGKISSAISEFRQVIKHDPRDYSTMNMLGDLYAKNSESKPAVECYRAVAEHYANQGFAHKAIAVYNKIAKLTPNTIEVSLRLGELYKEKGSIADARKHLEWVAAEYRKRGENTAALDVMRQVADLTKDNADELLKIGEGYASESCPDEAFATLNEAGEKFRDKGEYEKAFWAFGRALDLMPQNIEVFKAYLDAGFESGNAAEAQARVIDAYEKDPQNRGLHKLYSECGLRTGDTESAERSLKELMEAEPDNYPMLIELGNIYLKDNDPSGASRALSMASEYMLMNGKADELSLLVSNVLAIQPENLEALRMMARTASWLKDEAGMLASLNSIAKVAQANGSLEDERYALEQLVLLCPEDTSLAERLRYVHSELGIEEQASESIFDQKFGRLISANESGLAEYESSNGNGFVIESSNGHHESELSDLNGSGTFEDTEFDIPEDDQDESVLDAALVTDHSEGPPVADDIIAKELEGIRFYVESGFDEIAEKAIEDFIKEFGEVEGLFELRAILSERASSVAEDPMPETFEDPQPEGSLEFEEKTEANPVKEKEAEPTLQTPAADVAAPMGFDLSDLRSELGLDEPTENSRDDDFETHYHTAVAYQEMFLLEDAIKEFQQAIALVGPNDGTRRFFQCANLLGHCFMQLGKPNLAVKWFTRTLETTSTSDDERLGIWYELATAYEADGDHKNASKYYEQVYAENIDFRDVADKVGALAAAN
ncbi:tetratricopeptide repeat protein [Leptolyngbya sp. 7M]|uniref:tetratricopeptide repeat protein n=1 Tax=Leptolyngbya sp. 7M TaxID=2812896 RepID=UPI001B8C22D8|nr:tetratricopeptide repeat protein [Leptolyngbya sp. 7M]QYO65271.1 tetratricopeptide repeat protein [Leptolyngbya sp. 7M]